jgi:2-oxoglutarate dehydrogenase E2 component (dihydrolipoamide succinyltransferase)
LKRTKPEGAKVRIGDTIATIDPNGSPRAGGTKAPAAKSTPAPVETKPDLSPAVRRLVEESNVDPAQIEATGPGGRITKEDVLKYLDSKKSTATQTESKKPATDADPAEAATIVTPTQQGDDGPIRRVPMSKIRKKIAERLVQAQHTAAILTTFNEVDLSNVMALRAKYKETFEKKHGVGLGFMSFFAKAVVLGLKDFERVNAMIDGDEIVYHDYVHLGIAVSTDRGLAVPVVRNAHQMSFAKIESEIKRLAAATRDGKLSLQELSGGTFTITNGGVFGSLFATPIINPPQSGILGMHKIQERPVAISGKVEVRPMMYVSYMPPSYLPIVP